MTKFKLKADSDVGPGCAKWEALHVKLAKPDTYFKKEDFYVSKGVSDHTYVLAKHIRDNVVKTKKECKRLWEGEWLPSPVSVI